MLPCSIHGVDCADKNLREYLMHMYMSSLFLISYSLTDAYQAPSYGGISLVEQITLTYAIKMYSSETVQAQTCTHTYTVSFHYPRCYKLNSPAQMMSHNALSKGSSLHTEFWIMSFEVRENVVILYSDSH